MTMLGQMGAKLRHLGTTAIAVNGSKYENFGKPIRESGNMARIIFLVILISAATALVVRELKDILMGAAPVRKPTPPQPDPVPVMTEEEKIQFLQDCLELKSYTPSNKSLFEDER
jgi:hypothetical protein